MGRNRRNTFERLARLARTRLAPAPLRRDEALDEMERLSAITHLVASAEYLARPRDRRRGGFNNWPVTRRTFAVRFPRLAPVVDVVARPSITTALHALRIVSAAALIGRTNARIRLAADTTLAATSAVLYPRQHYGTDGTDQVAFLVQASTALGRATAKRPALTDAALWFAALQATLSYTVSGWVKLAGPSWRSGAAITGVTRTRTYGDEKAWRAFNRYPTIARMLGAGVLAMECLFPAVFLARGRLAPTWLHGTLLFHVVNARVMGLGRFVWAFGSMGPAVRYVTDPRPRTDRLGRVVEQRDDTLPRVTGAVTAAAMAAGLLTQARRRSVVLRGQGDEERLTTRAGNVLALRRAGTEHSDGPVVVLEHALLSGGDYWQWAVERIAQRCTTVAYSRAGYAASHYAGREGYRLDTAVDDLVDVARHVGRGRQVVVVGHSLGGWIALRAAADEPDLFDGLVLLDSSHPAELERSSRQAQGVQALTENLSLMPISLALGLGGLLERPDWIDELPPQLHKLALAQYRDGRLWSAGMREWRATVAEFDAFDGELPRLECPLLVLTAGFTALQDEIQEELHRELVDVSPRGEHRIIEGVDHDQVLFEQGPALRVADQVLGFVDGLEQKLKEAHAAATR